ncbi:MAG: cysteine--tRNA ligase [Nitriliruptoraceae bacterium]
MSLVLFDTLRRAEVEFVPAVEGRVGMYVCGPTVQAEPHVGHGRAAVVFDLLRRHLQHSGLAVRYVQNVTDIDDKIILRARREGTDAAAIATRYGRVFERTMDALGVLPPDVRPLATGHLLEMQELVTALIDADKAYVVEGDVFFRVRSFPAYGRLSNRRVDELVEGDDVVDADRKEDPLDFALWKAAKPGEPSWPSPWGRGRPGWHLECSAMSVAHLGAGFDIHGGGLDLVFPHHENEIAQHEAAHGTTFARHWVHNGMVTMGEAKMSKSVGNVVGLGDAVAAVGRGPLRLWYLSAQHRTPLTFDDDRLADAGTVFARFLTFARAARRAAGATAPDGAAGRRHRDAFTAALDDDLNAPVAVAALHELVADGGERLRRPEAEAGALADLAGTLVELADDVLGLGIADVLAEEAALGARVAPLVEDALARRAEARAAKDFAAADAIRDRLASAGVVVEDSAAGPVWHVPVRPAAAPR